ncbi:hypothetical protein Dimus_006923 [Dionaea muscipula]
MVSHLCGLRIALIHCPWFHPTKKSTGNPHTASQIARAAVQWIKICKINSGAMSQSSQASRSNDERKNNHVSDYYDQNQRLCAGAKSTETDQEDHIESDMRISSTISTAEDFDSSCFAAFGAFEAKVQSRLRFWVQKAGLPRYNKMAHA